MKEKDYLEFTFIPFNTSFTSFILESFWIICLTWNSMEQMNHTHYVG